MNKKIIALIIMIPLILLVVIVATTAVASIVVPIKVTGVKLEQEKSALIYMDKEDQNTFQIKARVEPAKATEQGLYYEWKSLTDGGKLEIDQDTGIITPKAVGKYTITVYSVDQNFSASFTLTVQNYFASSFELIEVLKNEDTANYVNQLVKLDIGDKLTLVTQIKPSNVDYQVVQWQTSNPDVIIMEKEESGALAKGIFKVVGYGDATITATYDSGNGQPMYIEYDVLISNEPVNKVVKSIEIIDGLLQRDYRINEIISINGIEAIVKYTDNIYNDEIIYLTSDMINGKITGDNLDTSKAGKYQFTVTYLNYTTSYFEYNVVDKIIDSVIITGDLSSIHNQVMQNEAIDITKIHLAIKFTNAIYPDENYYLSRDKIEINDTLIEGNYLNTVNVGEYEFIITDLKLIITFVVMPKEIINTTINGIKHFYNLGDSLHFNNPTISIEYSYPKYNQLLEIKEEWISNFNSDIEGIHKLHIMIPELNNYIIEFSYTVEKQVVENILFYTGFTGVFHQTQQSLDLSSIQFVAVKMSKYQDKELNQNGTDAFNENFELVTLSEEMIINGSLDLSKTGTYYFTIWYGGFEKEFAYTVYSNNISFPLEEVIAISNIKKFINRYQIGTPLNINSILLQIKYRNGVYCDRIVLVDSDMLSGDLQTNKVGDYNLIVNYNSHQLVLPYQVVETLNNTKAMYLLDTFKGWFNVGEQVNINDIKFVIIDFNDNISIINATNEMFDINIDTTETGAKKFKVTFDNFTKEFKYVVSDDPITKSVKELAIYQSLSDTYRIGDQINIEDLILIIDYQNEQLEQVVKWGITEDMIGGTINITSEQDNYFTITYKDYVFQFDYNVLSKNIKYIIVEGLEETYIFGSSISINSIKVRYYFENGYPSELRNLSMDIITSHNDAFIDGKLNTTIIGQYYFQVNGSEQIYEFKVIYREIEKINIISGLDLTNGIFLGTVLDPSIIRIAITFKDDLNNPLIMNLANSDLSVQMPDTGVLGSSKIVVIYFGYRAEFEIEIIEDNISSIKLVTPFKSNYLFGELINIEAYYINVLYASGLIKKVALDESMIIGEFKTNTDGIKNFIIEYEGIQSSPVLYVVRHAIFELGNKTSWEQNFSYQIAISKTMLTLCNIDYDKCQLTILYNNEKLTINTIKNNNNFIISGHFINNLMGEHATIKYQLEIEGVNFIDWYETEIVRSAPEFTINFPEYVKIGSTKSLSVNVSQIGIAGLKYTYSTSDADILIISGNQNNAIIQGRGVGIVKVTIIIELEENRITKEVYINVFEGYDGLAFAELPNGIVKSHIAIGRESYNETSKLYEVSLNELQLIAQGDVTVPNRLVTWFLVDPITNELVESIENVAQFINGKLVISNNLENAQLVTIKAIVTGMYMTDPNNQLNYAIGQYLLVPGVNINNYHQIMQATKDQKQIVLQGNINLGVEVFDIIQNADGTTKRVLKYSISETERILATEVSQLPTTANYAFYQNLYDKNPSLVSKAHPDVNYCIEFTNDLYGNGYTIDARNITTALLDINTFRPIGITPFNGPLDLVAIDGAAVKAQDNIAFLIKKDNLTINNVVLQSCEDEYLYEANSGELQMQLNRLNYVGTTLEIAANNINIINSRLKNGRNVVRIYGYEHSSNPDSVNSVNVDIESCILSTGREFILKVGSNQFLEGEYVANNPWSSVSPNLTNQNNAAYNPATNHMRRESLNPHSSYVQGVSCDGHGTLVDYRNGNAIYQCNKCQQEFETPYQPLSLDEYFMSRYVKTNLLIKNSTFENSGFFSIGVESQFAGPVLDGGTYGSHSFKENGWLNIAGTSYPSVITMEGDVRIYDWKPLSNVDSSTLIEGNIFEFNLPLLFKYFVTQPGYSDLMVGSGKNDHEIYVHGGIAFYGGGKNYSILINNMSDTKFPKAPYEISIGAFDTPQFADWFTNNNISGNVSLYKALKYASGLEPFRFYMYDRNKSSFTYEQQLEILKSSAAYANVTEASR